MADLLLEKFKISKNVQLNSEDIKSLTLLYLPLIGLDSYALYQTLTCLDIEEHTYKELINITTLGTLKKINQAIDKLEAIGLLKEYYKKDEIHIYELLEPLKESEFVKEELLMTFLANQIGPTEVEKLKNKHKPMSRLYKDVTKKFADVFTVKEYAEDSLITRIINNSKYYNLQVENSDFNYTLFKMYFDQSFMTEEALEEKEFKRMIYKISFTYKLNEEEMRDVVVTTITLDKRCDYAALSKNAKLRFKEKYAAENPVLASIKDDEYIRSIQDDEILALCSKLESCASTDILAEASGISPSSSELAMVDKLIDNLVKKTKFTMGAINFMLMYVITEKNGVIPEYNYFEKIANTWARAKVKTCEDAILYTQKRNKEMKEPKDPVGRPKKVAPLPSWHEEYKKNLDNNEEMKNEEASEKAKALAKALFEDD